MTSPITEKLKVHNITFGCDPEFFFEKKGEVVGSEKVIDIKKGLKVGNSSKIIVDGVQAELNPAPSHCRALLANEISKSFRDLYTTISKDKDLSVSIAPSVKITKEELSSLNEKSQTFGCAPSKNTSKVKSAATIRDPKKYMYRSAGGHIHIGKDCHYYGTSKNVQSIMNEPERLVAILDIIVGNTCVLLDRDPSNIERRKVYGRAGEYRTPPHGLEYRTLSNFWLRSYPLMSLVMNLTRFAVSILADSMPGRDFEKELLSIVDMKNVQKAINTNDFELAWNNFQKIKPFIARHVSDGTGDSFPLNSNNLDAFEFFVSKGMDYWFPEDPMTHWMKLPDGHSGGWETTVTNVIRPKMMEERPTPVPRLHRIHAKK